MRPAIMLSVALIVTLATLQPVYAQGLRGSAEAGRHHAINWCSGCHRIEPSGFGVFEADFAEIANLPSTTALSLRVFLRSSHNHMPNFILPPEDTDDIVAYILSLKRR